MAYIEWDYTVITSMVEKQGWNLPERESEEWNKFNDELGEKMRGVGIVFVVCKCVFQVMLWFFKGLFSPFSFALIFPFPVRIPRLLL